MKIIIAILAFAVLSGCGPVDNGTKVVAQPATTQPATTQPLTKPGDRSHIDVGVVGMGVVGTEQVEQAIQQENIHTSFDDQDPRPRLYVIVLPQNVGDLNRAADSKSCSWTVGVYSEMVLAQGREDTQAACIKKVKKALADYQKGIL